MFSIGYEVDIGPWEAEVAEAQYYQHHFAESGNLTNLNKIKLIAIGCYGQWLIFKMLYCISMTWAFSSAFSDASFDKSHHDGEVII